MKLSGTWRYKESEMEFKLKDIHHTTQEMFSFLFHFLVLFLLLLLLQHLIYNQELHEFNKAIMFK